MLGEAQLSAAFWGEALLQAVHLYNVSATRVLLGKTPHEVLLGRIPNNSKLRVFGCEAFVHFYKEQGRSKIEDHAVRGIPLSHCEGMYRVYMPKSGEFLHTKHVVFNESVLPDGEVGQESSSSEALELDAAEPFRSENPEQKNSIRGVSTAPSEN